MGVGWCTSNISWVVRPLILSRGVIEVKRCRQARKEKSLSQGPSTLPTLAEPLRYNVAKYRYHGWVMRWWGRSI